MYALTETQAGSDALAARLRADLSADGRHYVLNGQKMWITNGGEADLFTVFAKVGGERFTAFLVERGFGVRSGAEEHKMGLDGTSTTALYFDDVPVPVENVLGEVGRGHLIAFNILNVGRLELGPNMVRCAKRVLEVSIAYARDRRAFGSALADFGAIQHKLAEMATRIFAVESATWRVIGDVEARIAAAAGAPSAELDAFEELAPECSIVKVSASEMLDFVADEGVQIHGGYGYHRDYFVERAYRDARINRIFEGTNEINRLFIPAMLVKRANRGRLPLFEAAARAVSEAMAGTFPAASMGNDRTVAAARQLAVLAFGLARARHGDDLRAAEEVAMQVADMAIELFVMESALLRSRRLASIGRAEPAAAMAAVYLSDALDRIERACRTVVAAAASPHDRATIAEYIRRLASPEPIDTIGLRRTISERVVAAGRYVV